MRVEQIEAEPVHRIAYQAAAQGGGSTTRDLEIRAGLARGLPAGVDAVLVASDLQGVGPLHGAGGELGLLGEMLAEQYSFLAETGALPLPERVGVILAGDLYSSPTADKRGASGDVRPVWAAMAAQFAWVVGVAGNHDSFGTPRDEERLKRQPGVHLLDGECVELGGVRFAGVGRVIGDAARRGRRSEEEFEALLATGLSRAPDVLILHEGPAVDDARMPGSSFLAACLEGWCGLVICGHNPSKAIQADLNGGTQIINVHERALLLRRAD